MVLNEFCESNVLSASLLNVAKCVKQDTNCYYKQMNVNFDNQAYTLTFDWQI